MIYRRYPALGIIVFLLLGGLGFIASNAGAKKKPLEENVWVVVRPVTCLGNQWERDWMAHHKNRGDKYPRNKEVSLMKNYFMRIGSPLLDIRVKPYMKGERLCQTCGCERGYTLYLLVRGDNSPKLARLAYAERIPAEGVPNAVPTDDQ